MHLAHIGRAPTYLSDIVTATADLPAEEDSDLRTLSDMNFR